MKHLFQEKKMKILDVNNLLKNVIDEFNNTNAVMEKNIKFLINEKI